MKPPKFEVHREAIQITINKMEAQTILFFIIGTITLFFNLPFYSFFALGLCWFALVQILKTEITKKENDVTENQ